MALTRYERHDLKWFLRGIAWAQAEKNDEKLENDIERQFQL